jgi:hypothetical protein
MGTDFIGRSKSNNAGKQFPVAAVCCIVDHCLQTLCSVAGFTYSHTMAMFTSVFQMFSGIADHTMGLSVPYRNNVDAFFQLVTINALGRM